MWMCVIMNKGQAQYLIDIILEDCIVMDARTDSPFSKLDPTREDNLLNYLMERYNVVGRIE